MCLDAHCAQSFSDYYCNCDCLSHSKLLCLKYFLDRDVEIVVNINCLPNKNLNFSALKYILLLNQQA